MNASGPGPQRLAPRATGHDTRRMVVAAAATAVAFTVLFAPVLAGLVTAWSADESYSHGFLIVPLAAWFAWERRRKAAALPVRPSRVGLLVVAGSLCMFLAGTLGAELFLTRVALVGTIAGSLLFLCGWAHVRLMSFPLSLLLLMVPLPALVFNQVAFPLQLLASQLGQLALSALDIPVLREGNVIVLADTRLEVVEACSGIRSIFSLLAVGLVFGHFSDPRPPARAVLALATVPIAILANGLRVAGTGVAAHYYGPAAAEGFFHSFSGWLVFVFAFILLLGLAAVLRRLTPVRGRRSPHAGMELGARA